MIPYRGMLADKEKKEVFRRLNRISGQVDGIKRMVEEPRYCVDILTQIVAVRAALSSVGSFILEDHMKTCVKAAMKKGEGDRQIKELVDVFQKF
ncbi:hypothetical protein A2276_02030 [candidate division WOR-1 bacterium RIFOXYA12_FULL_43_27]|uniref:Transcriptional regulator n=1 Tax=candidate division WOR-1 bacterium RIFOXYC2_FULL_46_14 TaxID=1802587 RepID=A0A1F4U6G3_UNCSA|nr:MAG: hypothetical protein A2276_02030 [candidate division WOR-1 bacterium RIFOXYA12_FULL_43_27]OGC19499.1 MAG: hypothetical protein A2292_02300 [candidate division WOR-1 bacterium RIFOXYB2_FULL_46_45]OGC30487.1 MAG: hypothetical protein A2232_02300 [candidate division WOR-1 bacterium RIFOXYA2_FULL_46_56]OGC40555.1 MAG: hypothetical protein A2438_06015 [candidate division WOR-1 bacterium RIFOXYC2_FULL_46_14]